MQKNSNWVTATVTSSKWINFLLHYIAWELVYLLIGLPIYLRTKSWDSYWFNYGILGSINFVLFYIMAFWVIPKFFLQKRRIGLLSLIIITSAILFTIVKYRLEDQRYQKLFAISQKNTVAGKITAAMPVGPPVFSGYLRSYVWFTLIIVVIAFAYRLLIDGLKNEKQRARLENEKLTAELAFLKLQINPHFLFNALNNLYSLAVMEKGTKTSDGIMKLSDLIRYMLYEKEDAQNRVSLQKEIQHINSYIDLQRLRFDHDIYINFTIEGDVNEQRIIPLLLFPLVENAFKHGLLNNAAKPVSIQIKTVDHQLYFSISNYKHQYLKDKTGGIGLENVRRRLALLYPSTHEMKVRDEADRFFVELKLPL